MAGHVDGVKQDFQNINLLSGKISNLFFGRTESDRRILEDTIDDLNLINYRYSSFASSTRAVLLVNQCCTLVPTDDKILVQKCSKLIKNLLNIQNVCVEGRTLEISVQWCLNAIKVNENSTILVDIIQALDELVRNSPGNTDLCFSVTKELKRLLKIDRLAPDVAVYCIQCLEACTSLSKDVKGKESNEHSNYFEACADIFISYLSGKFNKFDELLKCKVLRICLIGLQNIVIQEPEYLKQQLGVILGLIKTYMVFEIKGIKYILYPKVMPSALSVPEVSVVREAKGGKLTKQRKHRRGGTSGVHKKAAVTNDELLLENKGTGYVPATSCVGYNSDSGINGNVFETSIRTSDSDFSDTEGTKLAKTKQMQAKVRQAALSLFHNVIKLSGKSVMFSYWSSFVPESSSSGEHNLITCILKEPSSRCRLASLNVLLLLLTTSKTYLLQAALSEKSSSFTPYCAVLGMMVMELHKCLNSAVKEMSALVLTQVLKCFAALVQATPYHKLPAGLITEVVQNVRPFIYYKDAAVQVTALIVLGCILAFEPLIPEIKNVMLKLCRNNRRKQEVGSSSEESSEQFEFAEFSDSDSENSLETIAVPWLLRRCLGNLGVRFSELRRQRDRNVSVTVATVKLESLQVLSAMSRNYFECLMASHLPSITKALEMSLLDNHTDLKLHAGRTVDFMGQAINSYFTNGGARDVICFGNCLSFWQTLLNKSLLELLQCEQHPILRAVGCDCLGSIGSHIFEQLQRDRQILCVTLLFSCTRDEEKSVKGAAVRALAICVLYPSLRQDPGFVLDTVEAISRTFDDDSFLVRIKASWSLGNLSDALVLNSKNCEDMSDEFPEKSLLQLLQISVKGAKDNDKIKMNAVRALGNLMQLITKDMLGQLGFSQTVEDAFTGLTNNCMVGSNMKVRWNACYALGNALKNPSFYGDQVTTSASFSRKWQEAVFNSLMELVVGFRNLKVRINAGLALSAPAFRSHYGNFFIPVWMALFKALENSQNVEDANEYKHRDHLVEQICLSLGHLVTLLTREDLTKLNEVIQPYSDTLKSHIMRVSERLIPKS